MLLNGDYPAMRTNFFDHLIVDIDTPERAQIWTSELGVSLPALALALHRAGPLFNDIREELGMARLYIFPRDQQVIGAHDSERLNSARVTWQRSLNSQ